MPGLGLLSAIWLATIAAAVWVAYTVALQAGLDRLALSGGVRVDQASERLVGQLDRYSVLVNLMARDPRVGDALSGQVASFELAEMLRNRALTYGAARIEVLDRTGTVRASSDISGGRISRAGAPLLAAALNGRLGRSIGLEAGRRQFRLSRGIKRRPGPPDGAVIVSVDIADLEFEWSVTPEVIAFFDGNGVVFAANRPALLLRRLMPTRQDAGRFGAFPEVTAHAVGAHRLWRRAGPSVLSAEMLVVERVQPRLGMTALGLIDTAPVRREARLVSALAAALAGLAGLALLLAVSWRRRVADRLAAEVAANARLEARVEERTADLRAAQTQLVQASKLSALGQMSANISHELNQPLSAIRTFAENGTRLLDLDRAAEARGNLDHIAQQVARIDRIIRNLRSFARNEDEPVEPVDLIAAVRAATELTATRLSREGIVLETDLPAGEVPVMGGAVRLQQVIVNLLNNAADALAGTPEPRIAIALSHGPLGPRLTVRDSGPGLSDPARVFEPFYTTKELGASKGLGLGLSISYGIIGSIGGEIAARTHPGGGAEFTVDLRAAPAGGAP